MTKQELEKNLSIIKSELETEVDEKIIDQVQQKLNRLCSLMGLSAECLKEAKSIVLYAQRNVIERTKNDGLSSSILKIRIEGELWEELALYTYADRLNAAIVHCVDGMRTICSLYKEEMKISTYGQ